MKHPLLSTAGHLALTALVIGTGTAIVGAGRVTLSLVASTAIVWAFIPLLQLLTGAWLTRDIGAGGVPRAHALARYAAMHRYWSLWMLMVTAALLLAPNPAAWVFYLAASLIAPLLLTMRALVRLRRECGDPPRVARRRVVLHQAMSLAMIALYVTWATALLARLASGPQP